ncbi:MAG: hypothetical protein V8Q17_07785 [Acutalibacteraceae bacterium]
MTVLEVMELQGDLYHMKSKLRKQGSETLLKNVGYGNIVIKRPVNYRVDINAC